MSYIYTVKPIKEAIKIAAESDDLEIDAVDGEVTIHGIDLLKWPFGERVERKERQERAIRTDSGWWVPLRYCNETEKADEVPEFIKGLYDAMTEPCGNIRCEKCPLDIMGDCTIFIKFIRDKWGIGK